MAATFGASLGQGVGPLGAPEPGDMGMGCVSGKSACEEEDPPWESPRGGLGPSLCRKEGNEASGPPGAWVLEKSGGVGEL
ncbi:hypothetical protein CSW41_05955 [Thermus scotoductus]|jgi:hypothetical protein|uniref:Uncharacterized protein n=1 Tax=Thermus scotoductus TaxID=37636 RepID=A0A430RLR1_THESC|nr:hypothetical protein CSW41_05955 [Thermus scotoductus]